MNGNLTRASILIMVCSIAAACDQPVKSGPSKPASKPIDGFGELKFGMSFEDALGALSVDLFNPVSLKECLDELPLKGCDLYPSSDDNGDRTQPYVRRDGIGYGLGLSFNRRDRLTDITLDYSKAKIVTAEQCRDLFGRTIDWLAQAYGPVTNRSEFAPDPKAEPHIQARTSGGIPFSFSKPSSIGFVTDFIRPVDQKRIDKIENGKRIAVTLNRGFWTLGSYIIAGGNPHCDVTVKFSEPDSVERAGD